MIWHCGGVLDHALYAFSSFRLSVSIDRASRGGSTSASAPLDLRTRNWRLEKEALAVDVKQKRLRIHPKLWKINPKTSKHHQKTMIIMVFHGISIVISGPDGVKYRRHTASRSSRSRPMVASKPRTKLPRCSLAKVFEPGFASSPDSVSCEIA